MPTVTFRNLTQADIPSGLRLCRLAGWNQLDADWELFLSLSPGKCRAAEVEGNVVGTVTTVNYENRFAWVGMVLVDPSARGQGIGTQLLQAALDMLTGLPVIRLDATPQGRPVYQRLGFEDEYPLSRMQIQPASSTNEVAVNSGGGSVCRRMTEADWEQVTQADRRVFGADRQAVLQWAWQQAPEYAWIVGRPAAVEGYCFGRRGFNFDQIGPIQAEKEEVARALVRACLYSNANARRRPLGIDPLHHSPSWIIWLERNGFVQQRPFTRMFLGENRYPGFPREVWAILGPEFG